MARKPLREGKIAFIAEHQRVIRDVAVDTPSRRDYCQANLSKHVTLQDQCIPSD